MSIANLIPNTNFFALRAMLAVGLINPNKPDRLGTTMLHHTALQENENYIRTVLKYCNDLNRQDRCGWAAIHYAALNGNGACIRLLAKAGATIDTPTNLRTKSTPLHLTASRLHFDATRELLNAGANPLATNIHDQTPLHEACLTQESTIWAHKLQIASLLIEQALEQGTAISSYVFAQDKNGKTAPDYLDEDDQEQFFTQCNQLRFKQMLKEKEITSVEYLRTRELGFSVPYRP